MGNECDGVGEWKEGAHERKGKVEDLGEKLK
jgi:hypothetical protein